MTNFAITLSKDFNFMNGFINYYKPSGISSAYAINRIKKLFKGYKVGHMGTLDPLAEGVLPLAVGKSTRLFDFLLDKTKVYIAEFTFGYQTDTLDRGGKIVKDGGKTPSYKEIESIIPNLVGKVMQVPPSFSAKNVGGERSYNLARRGVEVELKPKEVEIDGIKILSEKGSVFTFEITCKGGTYIRSICRDMANLLGTFATMTALKRTVSGVFSLENSVSEEDVKNATDIKQLLIKPDSVLTLNKVKLNKFQSVELLNGRPFNLDVADGTYSVYDSDDCFVGVGIVTNYNLKIKAYIKSDE